MQFVQYYACDSETGAVLPGAAVLVSTMAGDTAVLYDADGLLIGNPIIAGNSGRYSFAAADGDYTLTVSAGGEAQPPRKIYLFDPDDLASTISEATVANAAALGGTSAAQVFGEIEAANQLAVAEAAAREAAIGDLGASVDAAISAGATLDAAFTVAAEGVDQTLDEYVANLAGVLTTAEGLEASVQAAAQEDETAANAVIAQAIAAYDQTAIVKAAAFVAGAPVGPIAQATQTQTETLTENQTLMGTRSADGASWILNDQTTQLLSTGETVAQTVTSLNANIGAASAAVTTEALARASAVSALSSTVTTLQSTVASNYSSITSTYATSASVTAAVAALNTTLSASISGVSSNLSTNYLTSAQTNSAIAALNTSLTASIGGVSSNLSTNYLTSVQTNSAIAAATSSITTAYGAAINSAIYTNALSYSYSAGSLAAYIFGLNTNYGALSTTVSNNYSALSTANSATASSLSSLTSSYNGTAATVSAQGASLATQGGYLAASYTLAVNTSSGALATIQLLAAGGSVTNLGGIILDADYVQFKSSSHPAIQPFLYDATSGTLFLNNVTANSANIANLAVQTIKIAGGAVTNTSTWSRSAATAGTGGYVDVFNESFSISYGATILVFAQLQVNDGGGHSSTSHSSGLRFYINGTLVQTNEVDSSPNAIGPFNVQGSIPVGAGTIDVDIQGMCQSFDNYSYGSAVIVVIYK